MIESILIAILLVPAHVHLSPDTSAALVVLEGRVRWRHLAGALLGIFDRLDSHPHVLVLWDAREIKSLDITPDDVAAMKALVERLGPALDGGRSAFVARREVDGEIARLLARLWPRRREFKVFYRMDQALAFLGRSGLPELARSDRVRVLEVV